MLVQFVVDHVRLIFLSTADRNRTFRVTEDGVDAHKPGWPVNRLTYSMSRLRLFFDLAIDPGDLRRSRLPSPISHLYYVRQ